MSRIIHLMLYLIVALVVACGNETPTQPDEPLTLELVSWPDTLLVGEETVLEVDVRDSEGHTVTDVTVTWETTTPEILDLTDAETPKRQVVTGRGPGLGNITVRASGQGYHSTHADSSVLSLLAGVSFVSSVDSVLTAVVNQSVVHARGLAVDGAKIDGSGLEWSRLGSGSVTLTTFPGEDSATVIAQHSGTEELVVTHPLCDGHCADTTDVSVEWLNSIEVTRDSVLLIAIDDTAHLSALGIDRYGNSIVDSSLVQWVTADPSVAVIDSAGITTARNNGTTLVIAEAQEFEDSVWVTVDQQVANLVVPEPVILLLNDTIELRVDLFDANGYIVADASPTVDWGVVDPIYVNIIGSLATGIASGSTELEAAVDEYADTASILVTSLMFANAGYGFSQAASCGIGIETRQGYCWGDDSHWQLGNGDLLGDSIVGGTAIPTPISGQHSWEFVAVAAEHGCGITTSQAAYCWGNSTETLNRLGNEDHPSSPTPVPVAGDHTWSSISLGQQVTCGVTTERNWAYCWGHGLQLGNPDIDEAVEPSVVSGSHSWQSISVGDRHVCGIVDSGEAYCWGVGEWGQIGNNSTSDQASPVLVLGGHTWTSISAGWNHSCGITVAGEAYCWGAGAHGELGNGGQSGSSVPLLVSGGLSWDAVSAGGEHTCGITTSGEGYCWGQSSQLGTGHTASSSIPLQIEGNREWSFVGAGYAHTCGIATDQVTEAFCWGSREAGALGDGGEISMDYQLSPVRVASPGQPYRWEGDSQSATGGS